MFKVIAFGLAVGAAVQGFRQWPADGPVSSDAVVVLFLLGLVAAFLGGLWHGRGARGGATAVASARATSTSTSSAASVGNSVNVALIVPGGGAHARGMSVPGESVPWMKATSGPVTLDELSGLDSEEVASILELDVEHQVEADDG